MTTLVAGASGATGKHLVDQLLNAGQNVKVIVRSSANIPDSWSSDKVSLIKANVSEIDEAELAKQVKGCDAVACCLGHNLTWKGIYGKPRKLVADAVSAMCRAIERNAPERPVKFVLMNTAGNRNRDLAEPISFGEKVVVGLLRLLLPPHRDNEEASDFLRKNVGQKSVEIEWVVVRPDTLLDDDKVTEYALLPSPSRSALLNPGKTSRINVGNFMARLILEEGLWNKWKGQMPVIYNKAE